MTHQPEGITITFTLAPEEKAGLEALAQEFGILWGDKPNISGLIRAIARKRLIVHRPEAPISEKAPARRHRGRCDRIKISGYSAPANYRGFLLHSRQRSQRSY